MQEIIIFLSSASISLSSSPAPGVDTEIAIQFELQDEHDPELPTVLLITGSNPPILERLSQETLCEIEKLLKGFDPGVEIFDVIWR